jgi:hypothetical protein
MLRRIAAAGCAVAFVLVACSRGDDRQNAGARSPEASTPAPTPCSVQDGSLEPQRSDTTPPTAPLTDVRYSTEECPRIVFEFEDHEPAYAVEYAKPPFSECGSGEPISTEGWRADAFLVVRLEPSGSADLSKPDAPQTYDGPRDIDVGGRILKHLKVSCDFEAVVTWIVGLDARHEFSVFTLDDPSRIVIDISET